jgi:protein-tyrosine phosphatase
MRATSTKPSRLRIIARAIRSSKDRQDLIYELGRRRSGEPILPSGPIRRVMVICQGNICRSPFADLDLAARCSGLEVRSAGLLAREDDPAQPGALRIGAEFGVDLSHHAAHRLNEDDIRWADLIIGMQGWHQASVRKQWPAGTAKMRLLGDFLENAPYAIEDPWGTPDDAFRAVFAKISLANESLARQLRSAES